MNEEDFWNILKINLPYFFSKISPKNCSKGFEQIRVRNSPKNLFQLVSLPQLRPVPRHLFYFYVVFIVAIFNHYAP